MVKVHIGKMASEWIGEAFVLEAKVHLQDLALPIAHLADCLHFID